MRIYILLMSVLLNFISVGTVYATKSVYLIDFVVLKQGHNISDRDAYDRKVEPIAAKYNMVKQQSYNLSPMAGKFKEAIRLNIWKMPSMASMKKLGSDPAYKAMAPMRDKIHNMQSLTLYTANTVKNPGQIKSGHIMVDLVVMNKAYGNKERNAYEASVFPVAAEYGMKVTHVFNIINYKRGVGPQNALRLNLWTIEDPKKMSLLGKDARYKSLLPLRNLLHNMADVTLYKATPAQTK